MTETELRKRPEYLASMERIKQYRPGFELHMDWTKIPEAKRNALKIVLNDAVDAGLLKSVALYYDVDLNNTGETYHRTNKEA